YGSACSTNHRKLRCESFGGRHRPERLHPLVAEHAIPEPMLELLLFVLLHHPRHLPISSPVAPPWMIFRQGPGASRPIEPCYSKFRDAPLSNRGHDKNRASGAGEPC